MVNRLLQHLIDRSLVFAIALASPVANRLGLARRCARPHATRKHWGEVGCTSSRSSVTTKHGRMPCFVACPDGAGPFPPIIFYMDAPGTREELRNMARRIARHGYFCILPDMYYRLGTVRFDIPRRDDGDVGR